MHKSDGSLGAALLVSVALSTAGCNLPSVAVYPTNTGLEHDYNPLPAAIATVAADQIAEGSVQPFCEVRGGKTVRDDRALAKVTAGIAEWQRINKKTPPRPPAPPPAVDPHRSPVDVSAKGVTVSPGGLFGIESAPVRRRTDTANKPSWFAISCAGEKITATLEDQDIDLDALFTHEEPDSPELWLAGYSLTTKVAFMAKVALKVPDRVGREGETHFYTYDLSRYLTAKVERTALTFDPGFNGLKGRGSLHLYFLDTGSAAGLHVVKGPIGEDVDVQKFTVIAAAAK